ncbi:hypothetical protein [Rhodococcoides kroppenstedtii]|uniref:hypothetical protein n=1 Tax=Rhodococcoides kroppenstedtii TaxID=293050 RepID=UPI001427AC63|nr:hypothetical protein [Rhodococcus kroppenstedtii]
MPAALTIQKIPSSVKNEVGSVEDSVFSGRLVQLKSDDEAEIVRELESHGWTCGRDDERVRKQADFKRQSTGRRVIMSCGDKWRFRVIGSAAPSTPGSVVQKVVPPQAVCFVPVDLRRRRKSNLTRSQ